MPHFAKASLLFLSLLVCACAFFVAHRFREHVPAPVPRDLFAIVNQQLSAFRAADFRSAYRQAATGVQQKFTLSEFETMVHHSYPEMICNGRVEFGLVRVDAGIAFVQVYFFAADGSARSFLFSLINENNAWKIGGVEEVESYRSREQLAGTLA